MFPSMTFSGSDSCDSTKNFLAYLSGPKWQRVRRILNPTFTSGQIRRMFSAIDENSTRAIEVLLESTFDGRTQLELMSFVSKYVLNNNAQCCFAIDTNLYNSSNSNSKFYEYATTLTNLSILRLIIVRYLPDPILRLLNIGILQTASIDYFEHVIRHVLVERRFSTKCTKAEDFIQLLVDASDTVSNDESDDQPKSKMSLDEDEIVANAIGFLMAGYENTSIFITMILYELARNQTVQSQLRCHLTKLDKVDYESVTECEYLDAVTNETLRLHPSFIGFDRKAIDDYQITGTNIMVKKGMSVFFDIYSLHYDPNNFEHPELFNPDRFLPKNRHLIKPYTFLPFGSGPRICIGQKFAVIQAKLLIARLLTKFSFHFTTRTDDPPKYELLTPMVKTGPIYLEVRKLGANHCLN